VIKGWSRLSWLRTGTNGGSSRILYCTLSFHGAGISWPAEQLSIKSQLVVFNKILMKELAIYVYILWVMTPSVFRLYSAEFLPITLTARSKAWTVFARSKTGIVCSNPTNGMDVCVRLFCVCIVLCVVATLRGADPPSKESYRLCKRSRHWKSGQVRQGV
jgi:hypothetical protein